MAEQIAEVSGVGGEKRDRTYSSSLLDLKTVTNGLQVKLKTAPFASYTYGCSTSARPVDWKIIAADDQPGDEDHICCRTFNKGEDLNKLVAHSLNRYTKAIILVNIRDDYMVEPNMWPKEGNTPVFLLRNSDGYHLMSALEGHIQVWGKFDTENRTPRTPPSTQKVVDSSSTRPSSAKKAEDPKVELKAESKQTPPTQKKSDTSPRRLLKRGNSRKQMSVGEENIDLHGEIKKLLPVIVTEDSMTFAKAMSVFQRYEKTPRTDGNHGELLKKILKNFATVFEKDFPFYVILAHRINCNPTIYPGGEGPKFISTCIDRFETLGPLQYTSTLNGFFRRGDFSVKAVEPQVDNICAFQLLAKACYDLAALSSKLHPERRSSEQLIYKKMLWLCAALKCQSHYDEFVKNERELQRIWEQNIIQLLNGMTFTPEVVTDLRRGMNLTNLLKLPPAMMLATDQIIQLVLQRGRPWTFSHLTSYVDVVNGYIPETTHILHMFAKLHEFYNSWLKENYSINILALGTDGTQNSAVMEGLAFVEKLNEILVQRRINKLCEEDDVEIFKWLLLLLQMMGMTTSDSVEQLVRFLNGSNAVAKRYREKLSEEVVKRARIQFPQLTMELFLQLYKNFTFWPPTFVEEYFAAYKVLPTVSASQAMWRSELLTETVSRLAGAHQHPSITGLIRTAGELYAAEGRSQDFIIDLLKMNTKSSVMPENNGSDDIQLTSDLTKVLHDYIEMNALESVLSVIISKNSTNEKENYFQQHISTVLEKLNGGTAKLEVASAAQLDGLVEQVEHDAISNAYVQTKEKDNMEPPANGSVEPPANGSVEPPANGSVEPPANGSVEPPANGSVEPPASESVEPSASGSVEPPTSGSVEPPANGSVEPPASESVEPPANGSVEPPASESVEPPANGSAEPPAKGSVEPPASGSVEPPTSESVEPPANGSVEPPANGSVEPPANGSVEPPASESVEPPASESVEPPANGSVEPPANGSVEPPANGSVEPPANGSVEPPANGSVEPPANGSVEPPASESVEPPASESVEPPANGSVEPPANGSVEPPASESVEPPANGSVEPPANGSVEPPANGSVEPPASESVEPPASESVEPPANGSVEPPANGSVEPPANGSVEPPANGSVEPPANGSVEPPANGSVEPPASESVEPPANGSVEPPANGSVEPPANGSAEPPANGSVVPDQLTVNTISNVGEQA